MCLPAHSVSVCLLRISPSAAHALRAAERKAAQSRLAAEPQPHPDDVTLLPEVMAIEDEMVLLRRIMHMHPELLYEEVRCRYILHRKIVSLS